jgi:integrase/recombinase XerD
MFRRMTRERYLSDAELAAFMTAVRERRHVHQVRDHALFALLANTGIRPSEALALTRADLHPHARPAWIRVKRMKKRKAVAECDDIEISDRLAEMLATHLDTVADGEPVFTTNRRNLQRLFKLYARRAGLEKGHHLYVLRHTAATRMYVATRDINTVQAMLGHESPDTSCIYAHVPFDLLLETANGLPAVV